MEISVQLNRDTWGHEAVKDTVSTSFVFWQVCSSYELLKLLYGCDILPSCSGTFLVAV
jgi:hypothetical protein